MGRYRDLLAELLEKIRQSPGGEEKMREVFEGNREAGEEAMSREVLMRILEKLPSHVRNEFIAAHEDLKIALESRVWRQESD